MLKTETKTLMCQLTEHQLIERGEEMAKTYLQVAALDLEKKRITARIKPLDERIELLVTILDTKEEERQVECRWIYDFTNGIKRLYREDTGEEIQSATIKDWERQQKLPVDENLAMGAEDPQPDPDNVCYNTGCLQFDDTTENHCRSLQYTDDCDNPNGTGSPQEESNAGSQAEEETESAEEGEQAAGDDAGSGAADPVTLCAVCIGDCGDFTPGTQVSECPNHACDLSEDQTKWRDNTCQEWKNCGYVNRCFSPANEEDPVCISEQEAGLATVANKANAPIATAGLSAAKPTQGPEFACKICGFDANSKTYLTRHVEREHNMSASQYKKAFPANQTALQLAREKRAKLVKGAK